MTCNRQGAQGELNTASKSQLENEFGTSKEDDVLQKILQEGSLQETEVCVLPRILEMQVY
jgi:ribosome maturation protein Sdo1